MCFLRLRKTRMFSRRSSSSTDGSSMETPMLGSRGRRRRRTGCGLGSYLSTSFKEFASAVNPRITFRKRNSFADLETEKTRMLATHQVDQLRLGKLKRSNTTLTPNGNICFRKTPTQRGKKTQYLFRSLSNIGLNV